MASKNFSGILRDPLGTLANNDKYRFTHVSTTGEVIRGSTSYLTIGDDGVYNIDIEYGNVSIESYSELGKRWIAQGTTTINADTTATTLPALLNALVPASDALILQLEALLADAESAATSAVSNAAIATNAASSASDDAASASANAAIATDAATSASASASSTASDAQDAVNAAESANTSATIATNAATSAENDASDAAASAATATQAAIDAALSATDNTEVIKSILVAQGLSGEYGFFADGFTYVNDGDVGISTDNKIWIYVGAGAPNKAVAAGTVPSVGAGYEQVTFNSASNVQSSTGSVQDFIDSFELKVFQSSTASNTTLIESYTKQPNQVFEVRKSSDDTLATIYSDEAGTVEIVQNGVDNKSNVSGEITFYLKDGDYYIDVLGVKKHLELRKTTSLTFSSFLMMKISQDNLSDYEVISTSQHTSHGIGGATYVRSGNSGTPNTGNELEFYDYNGVGWTIKDRPLLATQFGALGEYGSGDSTALNYITSLGVRHIILPLLPLPTVNTRYILDDEWVINLASESALIEGESQASDGAVVELYNPRARSTYEVKTPKKWNDDGKPGTGYNYYKSDADAIVVGELDYTKPASSIWATFRNFTLTGNADSGNGFYCTNTGRLRFEGVESSDHGLNGWCYFNAWAPVFKDCRGDRNGHNGKFFASGRYFNSTHRVNGTRVIGGAFSTNGGHGTFVNASAEFANAKPALAAMGTGYTNNNGNGIRCYGDVSNVEISEETWVEGCGIESALSFDSDYNVLHQGQVYVGIGTMPISKCNALTIGNAYFQGATNGTQNRPGVILYGVNGVDFGPSHFSELSDAVRINDEQNPIARKTRMKMSPMSLSGTANLLTDTGNNHVIPAAAATGCLQYGFDGSSEFSDGADLVLADAPVKHIRCFNESSGYQEKIYNGVGGSSTAYRIINGEDGKVLMELRNNGRGGFKSLPTSASGLTAGEFYNDAGFVKVVT